MNYQGSTGANIAIIPLSIWYWSWFLECICCSKHILERENSIHDGKVIKWQSFNCAQFISTTMMITILIHASLPVNDSRLRLLYMLFWFQISMSFCYCCCGYVDNGMNMFQCCRKKYMEILKHVFSAGLGSTHHFYKKFLIIGIYYINQKKGFGNININPFNFKKSQSFYKKIGKSSDDDNCGDNQFREANLEIYKPGQYDLTSSKGNFFFNICPEAFYEKKCEMRSLNERLASFCYTVSVPVARDPEEQHNPDQLDEEGNPVNQDVQTRDVTYVAGFHRRFKKKIFGFECSVKNFATHKIHGDSENRFIYLLRPTFTGGNWVCDTICLYDVYRGIKHTHYYNILEDPDQSYDLSKDRYGVTQIRFIHYFQNNDTFLCLRVSNSPVKVSFLLLRLNINKLEVVNNYGADNLEYEVPKMEPKFMDFF